MQILEALLFYTLNDRWVLAQEHATVVITALRFVTGVNGLALK